MMESRNQFFVTVFDNTGLIGFIVTVVMRSPHCRDRVLDYQISREKFLPGRYSVKYVCFKLLNDMSFPPLVTGTDTG